MWWVTNCTKSKALHLLLYILAWTDTTGHPKTFRTQEKMSLELFYSQTTLKTPLQKKNVLKAFWWLDYEAVYFLCGNKVWRLLGHPARYYGWKIDLNSIKEDFFHFGLRHRKAFWGTGKFAGGHRGPSRDFPFYFFILLLTSFLLPVIRLNQQHRQYYVTLNLCH